MSERELFSGHALNSIDAKGRLAIPASFRKVIERNSNAAHLVIGRHEADNCLTGYDRGWSALLQARIERDEARAQDSGQAFDRHNINRRAFGLVEDIGFDASGRFILPAFFRAKAQLTDWVLFLGVGQVFELWNPLVCLAADHIDADTKDLVRFLLDERGVKA